MFQPKGLRRGSLLYFSSRFIDFQTHYLIYMPKIVKDHRKQIIANSKSNLDAWVDSSDAIFNQ